MTKKTDVAEIETPALALRVAPAQMYDRNAQSFDDLLAESHAEIPGWDLTKGDLLDELEGVPFMITRATFRRGFPSKKTKGLWLSYVSLECVIASEAYLKRRRVNMEGKPFGPNDHVVFNDGSTGVQRDVVEFLETSGWIKLPDGPAKGKMEESRFDAPPSQWADILVGDSHFTNDATDPFLEYNVDLRLLAPRGLRSSDYENEYTKDGKTRYLG